MIDVHCHVLPQVDDGVPSWEIAEKMCAKALEDGISHIVATPHSNSEYQYHRDSHDKRLAELRARVDGKLTLSLGMRISRVVRKPGGPGAGAEDISDWRHQVSAGRTERFQHSSKLARSAVPDAVKLGHPPYPDSSRAPSCLAGPSRAGDVVDRGWVSSPGNRQFLTGYWGKRAKAAAMWLLKKGAVHLLATDAHDIERRPPVLSKARAAAAEIVGAAGALKLVEDNPAAVVQGREVLVSA